MCRYYKSYDPLVTSRMKPISRKYVSWVRWALPHHREKEKKENKQRGKWAGEGEGGREREEPTYSRPRHLVLVEYQNTQRVL